MSLGRKGQNFQSLHAFVRGSGASTLPSQDKRFSSHAFRNDETKCRIRVAESWGKNLESRGSKFFIGSSQRTEFSRTQPNRKYQV